MVIKFESLFEIYRESINAVAENIAVPIAKPLIPSMKLNELIIQRGTNTQAPIIIKIKILLLSKNEIGELKRKYDV